MTNGLPDASQSRRYDGFADFYRFYLGEHKNRTSRRLHFLGSTLALICVLALVVTLMPSFLFSGFLFPIYSMPPRYQWASLAFPARHFTEISRGLALKGSGLEQLWPHLLALVIFAAVVMLLAVGRFHRRIG